MKKKRKAIAGGKTKLSVLIRNWIHQGFFYLDKTEMFYRVIWELIPICFFTWLFIIYSDISILLGVSFSILISHTLNWVFNDNFWACILFTFPKLKNPGQEKTIKYIQGFQKRAKKANSISGCMIYGSVTRNAWHNRSDLDLRVLRKKGFLNGLFSYLYCFKERLIAVWYIQPLDFYLVDNVSRLVKDLRKDEFPIFLKNQDKRLFEIYDTQKETFFINVTDLNNIE